MALLKSLSFDMFSDNAPEEFLTIVDYFIVNKSVVDVPKGEEELLQYVILQCYGINTMLWIDIWQKQIILLKAGTSDFKWWLDDII